MQFRDLHRQYAAMKVEMDEALLGVAASGAYIMGDIVASLEQQLADYVGVRHCITCANGTDALRMAVMTLGIGPGDAVFVPDFTFFATAEAVAMTGATPVFVDVCPDYNIDSDSLKKEFSRVLCGTTLRPAAVIAVDLFGLPADYDVLRAICSENGLLLIEDGAQGFGGRIGQRRACSFGDISTTSFFPAKPLGCYGDGGALFTDNDDYAEVLRSLRVHGRGKDKYDNVRLGFNSRLDSLQAAVLQVKLRHFDDEIASVNRVASEYNTMLKGKVLSLPKIEEPKLSSWAQYTVCVEQRDQVQAFLQSAGIPTMVYYPRTLSQQTAFSYIKEAPCPDAVALCGKVLSLPMHPYMAQDDIEQVAAAMEKAVNQ